MPRSLAWFVLTGIIYLLQLFPLTGIYLFFLGAPFWSVFLINGGFVSLAVEAMIGRISRLWLAAPLAWFGGYLVAAALNHLDADELVRTVAQSNEGKTLPFSSETAALVIDTKLRGILMGDAAASLVESYALPVAYVADPILEVASHRAYRIGGRETCRRLQNASLQTTGVVYLGLVLSRQFGRPAEGLCRYSAPEDPKLPPVTVTSRTEQHFGLWLPHTLDSIRVADASGRSIDLLGGGYVEPLSWLPRPVLGCGLNSAKPSWDCVAMFRRETQRLGEPAVAVIARALGLRASPAAERREAIEAAQAPDLDAIAARHVALWLANLERIVADPTQQLTMNDVAGLAERPDLLGPRAETMTDALARALDGRGATRGRGLVLQRLLATLDARDLARIGDRLLAVFTARPSLDLDMIADELAARLGDLGPAALPVLERLAFAGKRPRPGPVFGLCRVGRPAAVLADRVAAVLMTTKRTISDRSIHSAAYVTLLRMGRPDLADRDPDASSESQAQRYADLRRSVTPASPPSVCVDHGGWPKLPPADG